VFSDSAGEGYSWTRGQDRAPLSPCEVRRALVAAIAARPAESWVAFELAETLARTEYRRGAVETARTARRMYQVGVS